MEPYIVLSSQFRVTQGRSGLCPHCHKETGWNSKEIHGSVAAHKQAVIYNTCQICGGTSYDLCIPDEKNKYVCHFPLIRLWPISTPAVIPPPNPDMPEKCMDIYNEAALVFTYSHRAAAALLRLCLQLLLTEAKIEGKTIDQQIQNLIKSGEDPMSVLCMDICRILGNESVHPGTINLNEDTDTAAILFMFINMATDRLFTAKRKIDAILQKLPEGARKALEDRNARLAAESTQES